MSELAITIWVIGWLFASGVHYDACEETNQDTAWYWAGYIVLLFLWPHYLGVSWGRK